ncbi:Uncharacterised protein [Mycobacterium tuberculosis]|nr:Uncharacterised protein [Mycobacterium tuberculosis]
MIALTGLALILVVVRPKTPRGSVVRPKTPRGDGNNTSVARHTPTNHQVVRPKTPRGSVVRPKTPRGDGNMFASDRFASIKSGRQTQNPERGRKH